MEEVREGRIWAGKKAGPQGFPAYITEDPDEPPQSNINISPPSHSHKVHTGGDKDPRAT